MQPGLTTAVSRQNRALALQAKLLKQRLSGPDDTSRPANLAVNVCDNSDGDHDTQGPCETAKDARSRNQGIASASTNVSALINKCLRS